MADNLPQKYQDVARALIPYKEGKAYGQMALITLDPSLPCFLCGHPALMALIAPAPEYASGESIPWLMFPLCSDCEERQVKSQVGEEI